jgi:hypothetical protein
VKIAIDSYLTERKLKIALQELFADDWIGGQVSLPGSRRKFDMAFREGSTIVLVEYDGDEHYRNSLKVKADKEKDALAANYEIRVVRVPYWTQLDRLMVKHWFGLDAEVDQTFPHGFITTKLFPASFCELGIQRFIQELAALPVKVRESVIASLKDRVAEHGIEYVVPEQLRILLIPTSRCTSSQAE